ncbi:type II toxin-antitoxin system Phd/YefM family antitoxin [Spirillospora sp. NPDC048911]|uniref:type II toxin-antitoxin system Phd/YefM family antitoxin n=1 Tax=Spirillospora sp. NPDC048911 TaxID=3364527 RepID=UPI003713AA1C
MNPVDVPVTEARANFADLVNRVSYTGEPIALTRRGRVMAAIVSAEDLELLRLLKEGRIDLTQAGPGTEAAEQRPVAAPQPMRIAAQYRPPGPPPRPPGFGR